MLCDAYMEEQELGCAPISLGQFVKADKEFFKCIKTDCGRGIRPMADGSFPMEVAVQKAMELQRVLMHLQPRHKSGGAADYGPASSGDKDRRKLAEDDDMRKLKSKVQSL